MKKIPIILKAFLSVFIALALLPTVGINARAQGEFTITYDLGGTGYFDGNPLKTTDSSQASAGEKLSSNHWYPPVTSKQQNMILTGWKDDQNKTYDIYGQFQNYIVSGNVTFTPVWSKGYILTFDGNGLGYFYNNPEETKTISEVPDGQNAGSPDFTPSSDTMTLAGWTDEKEGTVVKYSAAAMYSFQPESDMTFYPVLAEGFTVTFDFNGGYNPQDQSTSCRIVRVAQGSSIGTYIPVEQEGKVLSGWQKTDGSVISANQIQNYTPQGNETLTAIWQDPLQNLTFNTASVSINNTDHIYETVSIANGNSTDVRVYLRAKSSSIL